MESTYREGTLVKLRRPWGVYTTGDEVYLQRDPDRNGCVTIHPQPSIGLSDIDLTHINVEMLEPVPSDKPVG